MFQIINRAESVEILAYVTLPLDESAEFLQLLVDDPDTSANEILSHLVSLGLMSLREIENG